MFMFKLFFKKQIFSLTFLFILSFFIIPYQVKAQNLYGLSSQALLSEVGNNPTSSLNQHLHRNAMTPYEAARARYQRLMKNRSLIKHTSISCLPLWCVKSNYRSNTAAVQTAQRVAQEIEKNHHDLLKTRIQNEKESEKARIERAKQERNAFLKKIEHKNKDLQKINGF